jgi:hypothetical protein
MAFGLGERVMVSNLHESDVNIKNIRSDWSEYLARRELVLTFGVILDILPKRIYLVKMDQYKEPLRWHELSLCSVPYDPIMNCN